MTTIERTYYPNGKLKTETEFSDGVMNGKHLLYSESGQLLVQAWHVNGKTHGKWTEYYENGQLAEEGEYFNNVYKVRNFWNEQGEQLLINGTGMIIRKYGALEADIYEQYFENGEFTEEKKIASLKIIENKPDA